MLVPTQKKEPQAPVEWQASRLSGSDSLADRASRKLRADQLLITTFGGTLVRRNMDDVPLWRSADHVPVRTLIEDYAQQMYLDRLTGPSVLTAALSEGVGLLT